MNLVGIQFSRNKYLSVVLSSLIAGFAYLIYLEKKKQSKLAKQRKSVTFANCDYDETKDISKNKENGSIKKKAGSCSSIKKINSVKVFISKKLMVSYLF